MGMHSPSYVLSVVTALLVNNLSEKTLVRLIFPLLLHMSSCEITPITEGKLPIIPFNRERIVTAAVFVLCEWCCMLFVVAY